MFQKISLTVVLQWMIGLLLFVLPWQTIWVVAERTLNGEKWQYGTQSFYAVELLLWLTVAVFIFWFWKKGKGQFSIETFSLTKDRLFLITMLFFIGFLYLSSFWAPVPELAIQQSQRVMGAFTVFLILFLGPLSTKDAIRWFVAGAVIQSFIGIVQFGLQTTVASTLLGIAAHPVAEPGTSVVVNDTGRWLRAYGGFAHPNVFGGYLVLALILFRVYAAALSESWYKYTPMVYAVLLSGLFFTFSRSAWLALGIFLAFELYAEIRKKGYRGKSLLITALISLVILPTFFSPIVLTRIFGGSAHEVTSTGERIGSIGEAMSLSKDALLFGVGAGNYTAASYLANPTLEGWRYQPVHNIDLLLLVEVGVVGLTLCLLALFYFLNLWVFITGRDKLWLPFALLTIVAPIAVFDHYLWTSFTGITMIAAFLGIMLRKDGYLSTFFS